MIAGLLLAAGRSSRFGGDKLLAPLRGRPVIRWSADALAASVSQLYVVVPPEADALRDALRGLDVAFVEHRSRDDGLGSSIAAGVSALPAHCEALLLALGDQPFVRGAESDRLIRHWRRLRPPAVVPSYEDGRGHPVLFDRACFAALTRLTGDEGARAVLDELGQQVAGVDSAGPRPIDVDTRDALRALENGMEE